MLNVSDPVAPSYPPISTQRETGNRRVFQVPGLGPQVSGTGVQAQVRVPGKIQILNLYPNPNT